MSYMEFAGLDETARVRMEALLNISRRRYWKRKRAFDIVFSACLLLLLLPFLALVAAVIYLDDPHASPIFKQVRIGRHGRPFMLYKFRTMVAGAEEMRGALADRNEMDGPVFKIRDDPRITRVGKFFREVSIDELPQLFNVLKGDLSMVGPRPPLPDEVACYTDYQKLRLIVTPGLTCTWQISPARNDISFQEWVEMDLDYIQSCSMRLDLKLICKTPLVMLRRGGR